MRIITRASDNVEIYITGIPLTIMKDFLEAKIKTNSKIGKTKLVLEPNAGFAVTADLYLSEKFYINFRSAPTNLGTIKMHGFEVAEEDEKLALAQEVLRKIEHPDS